jgi:hypothetical protein
MAEMAGTPIAQEGAPLGEILADPGASRLPRPKIMERYIGVSETLS